MTPSSRNWSIRAVRSYSEAKLTRFWAASTKMTSRSCCISIMQRIANKQRISITKCQPVFSRVVNWWISGWCFSSTLTTKIPPIRKTLSKFLYKISKIPTTKYQTSSSHCLCRVPIWPKNFIIKTTPIQITSLRSRDSNTLCIRWFISISRTTRGVKRRAMSIWGQLSSRMWNRARLTGPKRPAESVWVRPNRKSLCSRWFCQLDSNTCTRRKYCPSFLRRKNHCEAEKQLHCD